MNRFSFLILAGLLVGCTPSSPPPVVLKALPPITSSQIKAIVSDGKYAASFVNIWATWCEPCKEELPGLLQIARNYRDQGVRLILISADFESQRNAASQFLDQLGVNFPTYWKNEDENTFINGLTKEWSGAIPVTLLYDRSGKLRHFWNNQDVYANFERVLLVNFPELKRRTP